MKPNRHGRLASRGRGPVPWLWALPCPARLVLVLAIPFLLLDPVRGAEELRGLWVDTFHAGLRNEGEVRRLVADARAGGFNALFVEVRKRGDAYYESAFEPKAADVAAGFDPLGRLLELAHDTASGPRLAIHAWVVAFNIWNNQSASPPQPDHPYRRHPEWLTRSSAGATWDGANYAFDPGHPGVQEHTFNVAMDLVRRYPIDGLHWDYIRYAGSDWGYNDVAVQRFNARNRRTGRPSGTDPGWLQFRRDQITGLVRKVYLHALAERPALEISAATITFAPGISTTAQWPTSAAYASVLQDWRAWMEEGILDWNLPMAYFRQTEHFSALASWNVFIKDHQYRRRAAIGLGCYLNSTSNSLAQIRLARRPTSAGNAASGVLVYAYSGASLDGSREEFLAALTRPSPGSPEPPFAAPATPPVAVWKTSPNTGHLHGAVRLAHQRRAADGAEVRVCGPVERVLVTDGTGYFGTVDLPPGDYSVRVSLDGFETLTADASVPGAGVATLEFDLVPLDAAGPGAVRVDAGLTEAVVSWSTPEPATSWLEVRSGSVCNEPVRIDSGEVGVRHDVLLAGLGLRTRHTVEVVSERDGVRRRSAPFSLLGAGSADEDRADPGRLPGWWARHFFGTNAVPGTPGIGPRDDFDQDGRTNAEEHLAGTDPTRRESRFVVGLSRVAGAGWRVLFGPRVTGRRYRLERLASRDLREWEALNLAEGPGPQGGGVFEVPADGPESAGVFRVAVLWPQ